jgi:hypothetical protein
VPEAGRGGAPLEPAAGGGVLYSENRDLIVDDDRAYHDQRRRPLDRRGIDWAGGWRPLAELLRQHQR